MTRRERMVAQVESLLARIQAICVDDTPKIVVNPADAAALVEVLRVARGRTTP